MVLSYLIYLSSRCSVLDHFSIINHSQRMRFCAREPVKEMEDNRLKPKWVKVVISLIVLQSTLHYDLH